MKIIDKLRKLDKYIFEIPAFIALPIYGILFFTLLPLVFLIPFCIWFPILKLIDLIGTVLGY